MLLILNECASIDMCEYVLVCITRMFDVASSTYSTPANVQILVLLLYIIHNFFLKYFGLILKLF